MVILTVSLLSFSQQTVLAGTSSSKGLTIEKNVTVNVNGQKVTFKDPILNKNGHLFLPMRNVYEIIDATVQWNQKTKTASAVRHDNEVAITVNSKIAIVNGKKVTVNVPPFLYKDKTYVPIRFLSENLGGSVQWNQQTRTVDIMLKDEQKPVDKPYYLHINNKRIVMNDPIITKQNRTYIPAHYFYENLENATGKWLSKDQFELQLYGLIFVFTNGSNIIQINDEMVVTEEQPFIQSENMYVPVKFIVNTVGEGGNVRYLSDTRELYVYLYQSMFTSKFLEKSFGATPVPQNIPNAKLDGARSLLVSDNPETLTTSDVPHSTATLAAQNVVTSNALNEHRIFSWHYNTLGQDIQLAITIENKSATTALQVVNSKGTYKKSSHSWINYDIGLPIADQALNNKLQRTETDGMTIAPGETKIIQSYDLLNSYIIGFMHDFDIQSVGEGERNYTIRTVLAKNNEDVTTIHSDPVAINAYAAHPRGVWPSSAIIGEFPTYQVDSKEVGYSISNSKTDHLLTKENSLAQVNGSVGNSGHFGINYMVNIPVANPTGQAKTVKIKLSGRGGLYSGAIKFNGQVHLIPTLKPGKEYIELPGYTVDGANEVITLEFMHSGGSNLPLAIYIGTE